MEVVASLSEAHALASAELACWWGLEWRSVLDSLASLLAVTPRPAESFRCSSVSPWRFFQLAWRWWCCAEVTQQWASLRRRVRGTRPG